MLVLKVLGASVHGRPVQASDADTLGGQASSFALSEVPMALSVRTRFEILKRDRFTCRYCGRLSPNVLLEVDHIVPLCEGGTDDPINLAVSCWECNRGKAGIPLSATLTGEDPHDRAITLLETERQLREYNTVLAAVRERREADAWELVRYWENDETLTTFNRREWTWLLSALGWLPAETLRDFMDAAIRANATRDFRYVKGCVRTMREQVVSGG